jgi:hypothetical protein
MIAIRRFTSDSSGAGDHCFGRFLAHVLLLGHHSRDGFGPRRFRYRLDIKPPQVAIRPSGDVAGAAQVMAPIGERRDLRLMHRAPVVASPVVALPVATPVTKTPRRALRAPLEPLLQVP